MKYIDDAPIGFRQIQDDIVSGVRKELNVLLRIDDIDQKINMWKSTYAEIIKYQVSLNADEWIYLLDDNDIGPTIEDRDQKRTRLINGLSKPLRRVNTSENFQLQQYYLDRGWVDVDIEDNGETVSGNPTTDAYDNAMSVVNNK